MSSSLNTSQTKSTPAAPVPLQQLTARPFGETEIEDQGNADIQTQLSHAALFGHGLSTTQPIQRHGEPDKNVVQRDILRDNSEKPNAYEFEFGTEISQSFARLAQKLTRSGEINDESLCVLRKYALRRKGTINDHERLFMAGLLESSNVEKLQAISIKRGASIIFPLTSISPSRVEYIINFDRESAPENATEEDIVKNSLPFRKQANKLIAFMQQHGISNKAVLSAMLSAASDSSAGDKVIAGTAYAVASQAGHPLSSDIQQGNIKIDALNPSSFSKLPSNPSRNTVALYAHTAHPNGMKGDTIYLKTSFDIDNLRHRSFIIHELEHAQQDKSDSEGKGMSRPQAELDAFRSQARYILEQLSNQGEKDFKRGVNQLKITKNWIRLFGIEAQNDPEQYRNILEKILKSKDFNYAMTTPVKDLNDRLLEEISEKYQMNSDATVIFDGLTGESLAR